MALSSSVPIEARWRARAIDAAIFVGLFLAYLAWLLVSARDLGYARDEGFYFHAAQTYGRWFEILFTHPARAFEPGTVDRYWEENHEHPALLKSLFWASQHWLEGRFFAERGTAYRFPAMVLSSLAVAITFAWGRRCIGRAGGVVAALSFALMPQVFYHSHLACFDMPIAAMWLFVAAAYHRSLERGAVGWAFVCAILYGLALDTKHNAWFLPSALVAHAILLEVPGLLQRWRGQGRARSPVGAYWQARRARVPYAILLMALLGPLVFYALWPWIWRDTLPRLEEYVRFHMQHVYYNMEFLGKTYFEPPFPRSYAWVMTFATVPAITLLMAALGAGVVLGRSWRRQRPLASDGANEGAGEVVRGAPRPGGWASLWALCILVSYGPWVLTSTPIFGGTKHWLTAYPFVALFAGQGFAWLRGLLAAQLPAARQKRMLFAWGLGVCTLLGPLVMTWRSHPWGLSAYTPLVGGAPGAATLGLNRSFWGYTTGSVANYLNGAADEGARVFVHDTAMDSFRMLQKDGRLRSDLKPWWTVSGSKFGLYHHEQHMSRVEHMTWVDYGTVTPAHVATYDGVPMIWVYRRGYTGPGSAAADSDQPPM